MRRRALVGANEHAGFVEQLVRRVGEGVARGPKLLPATTVGLMAAICDGDKDSTCSTLNVTALLPVSKLICAGVNALSCSGLSALTCTGDKAKS